MLCLDIHVMPNNVLQTDFTQTDGLLCFHSKLVTHPLVELSLHMSFALNMTKADMEKTDIYYIYYDAILQQTSSKFISMHVIIILLDTLFLINSAGNTNPDVFLTQF